ncbi:type II toxin-antitoxin system mRNA interferase toxin, RelE/StbE family [Companilactobacillus zhachilii]|uniref:Type II toxin-antitoxin system mRNA interferase toxin, RelE/StbE family n=1 Tax=Companilactobacillus zhachilii TaxID=2304606 RepID=A0A386PV53_9LACO|nr:type II toxin-antitoxin system mRNA interferase toxin, RelE/StbE family [Companilactobacillus zhachilii]
MTKLLESEEYDIPKEQYNDHQLRHQAKGIRDVHIADDLVTVYYRIIGETITMLDVGPHSKIFRHKRRF